MRALARYDSDNYIAGYSYDRQIQSYLRSEKLRPKSRECIIPVNRQDVIDTLIRDFDFCFPEQMEPEKVVAFPPMPELNVELPLKITPYPYQQSGIAYAIEKKRCLIGDRPGLGKTMQAIASVSYLNAFPCLVICPASLKLNWKKEWEKFSYHRAEVLNDSLKNTWPYIYHAGLIDVFITNYESLGKYFRVDKKRIKGMRLHQMEFNNNLSLFKSIIIDESHRVKDPSTLQSKYCKAITTGKEVVYLLSGTPVVNTPNDLIPQLAILDRLGDFGGLKTFKQRYDTCGYLKELHSKLRLNCFFSREKESVLTELPEKVRQLIPCDITTQDEYDVAMNDLKQYLIEYKNATEEQVRKALKAQILVSFGILKGISARGKLDNIIEIVSDIIQSGEKVVVFCHLKEIAEHLCNTFPQAVTILGKDNAYQRDSSVVKFQTDDNTKVIICSIKAAGVGLTLTASSRVVFIELPWTAADCEQCEDRCHRIGQKDSVHAMYLLGKRTIDEWIYNDVISPKRSLAKTISGGTHDTEEILINSFAEFIGI